MDAEIRWGALETEWGDEEVQENVLNVAEVLPEGLSTPCREQEFGNGETQNDHKMELYRR